jgi:hypothetical protein
MFRRTLIQQNGAHKNKLRSTMTDGRPSALELLCVESDVLDSVSFTDVIEKLATTKSRKRLRA